MISINKIREKSGLLLIIVGIAMLAFILGDLFSSKPGQTAVNIGEIAGENVEAADFEKSIALQEEVLESINQKIDENGREQIRNQVWSQLVRDKVLGEQFDKLGLNVSEAEYDDVRFGNNILPDLKNDQSFADPKTGQFNPENVKRLFQTIQEQYPMYWQTQRDRILETRKMAKYNNLIRKGLMVNKIQAEAEYVASNRKLNMNFAVGRFASIPDSTVKPTEDEVRAYFDAHKKLEKYKQTESRSIDYVVFEIKATPEDIKTAEQSINSLVDSFKTATNDSAFVTANSDSKFYMPEVYQKGSAMPSIDSMISKSSKGTVIGPYLQGENLRLVKVVSNGKVNEANARHILIKPKAGETVDQVKAKLDSIKGEIIKNKNFAEVARMVSEDGGSAQNGGELNWFGEGQMVKPFEDACLTANKGDFKIVETQYGVHLIEVTDKRQADQIKLAVISRSMAPSKETNNQAYEKASTFSINNNTTELFNSAVEKDKLVKQSAPNVSPQNKFIPGISDPTQLIRWMNNAEFGDVSEPFEVGNQFVVANLTLITEEGEPSFESVKDQMEREVIKEKKAKLISAKIKGGSLNAIATALGETVMTASDITFNASIVPNAGREPKVIGVAVTLPKNKVSKPIVGENGVYVLEVTQITEAPSTKDYTMSKTAVSAKYVSRVDNGAFYSLIELAKVKDYRYKFY